MAVPDTPGASESERHFPPRPWRRTCREVPDDDPSDLGCRDPDQAVVVPVNGLGPKTFRTGPTAS
ncbi:hypothetical protein PJI17_21295 [Mycobacterium kansasii]